MRTRDEGTWNRLSYQLFLHLFIGRATTPWYHRCCFPSFPLVRTSSHFVLLFIFPFVDSTITVSVTVLSLYFQHFARYISTFWVCPLVFDVHFDETSTRRVIARLSSRTSHAIAKVYRWTVRYACNVRNVNVFCIAFSRISRICRNASCMNRKHDTEQRKNLN